jgi:hypothetical protein
VRPQSGRATPGRRQHAARLRAGNETGAAKAAWDKAEKEGGDAPAPCGDLGIYFDRAPIFWIMRDDPTTVIVADMGSEIQIFDPTTLRHLAPR